MLRFRALTNPNAAYFYYATTDSGLDPKEQRNEVGGKGAELLGLNSNPDFNEFKNLLAGLHPKTGEQLTAKIVDNRLPGWDVTASAPKSVTLLIEAGDQRVADAFWSAGKEAMADLEEMVTTRVRKSSQHDDRKTQNLIYFAYGHRETRPAKEDNMPDPDFHVHYVVPNITFDSVEREFKAIKFRPIMDMRNLFTKRFDLRLSTKLAELGYNIETRYKADERGGRKYLTWDVAGIPQSLLAKNSRRSAEVEKLADDLGISSKLAKDRLGATSRQNKRVELTLDQCRAYWQGKITPDEHLKMTSVIFDAMQGTNPRHENTAELAMAYAIRHEFERQSVINWNTLAITAMEKSMGGAFPDEFKAVAERQGVLFAGKEVTTEDVLAEETRIIAYAREGKGTCRPLASPEEDDPIRQRSLQEREALLLGLSPEQQNVCRHIWDSTDRVIMVEGDPGTGKTRTLSRTIPGIDRPGVFLAPSAAASRGTLRSEGFANAQTITHFLAHAEFREHARNGFIFVDEAPMAGLGDIDKLFQQAKELNAIVILSGDRKQHLSISRGNLFEILDKYAQLPVARMKENWRQRTAAYKQAAVKLSSGDLSGCYAILERLGWIKHVPEAGNRTELLKAYFEAADDQKTVQAICPTHREGDEVTAAIREELRHRKELGGKERQISRLTTLGWTEAEKGDLQRYDGSEVLQYFRNTGSFRAGQRVKVADVKPGQKLGDPKYFVAYCEGKIGLSAGERIRTTANVKAVDGQIIDNGSYLTLTGFTRKGELKVTTPTGIERLLPSDVAHIAHGYVITSRAAQSKTVDVTVGALGKASSGAMNMREFLVDVTRARDRATIFTDMDPDELRAAIARQDTRKSATELQLQRRVPTERRKRFLDRVMDGYDLLRRQVMSAMRNLAPQPHKEHAIG